MVKGAEEMSKILIGTPFKDIATDNYIKSLADLIIHTMSAGHEVAYINEHGGLFDAGNHYSG